MCFPDMCLDVCLGLRTCAGTKSFTTYIICVVSVTLNRKWNVRRRVPHTSTQMSADIPAAYSQRKWTSRACLYARLYTCLYPHAAPTESIDMPARMSKRMSMHMPMNTRDCQSSSTCVAGSRSSIRSLSLLTRSIRTSIRMSIHGLYACLYPCADFVEGTAHVCARLHTCVHTCLDTCPYTCCTHPCHARQFQEFAGPT